MKPRAAVEYIRKNQNNNLTLKSLFASQFLGKFSEGELVALKRSIDKELGKREKRVLDDKIAYLESLGYNVSK